MKNIAKSHTQKVENESFLSKVGDSFVGFHLGEVISLRERDWEALREYFVLPQNPKDIDTKKIYLKQNLYFAKMLQLEA